MGLAISGWRPLKGQIISWLDIRLFVPVTHKRHKKAWKTSQGELTHAPISALWKNWIIINIERIAQYNSHLPLITHFDNKRHLKFLLSQPCSTSASDEIFVSRDDLLFRKTWFCYNVILAVKEYSYISWHVIRLFTIISYNPSTTLSRIDVC